MQNARISLYLTVWCAVPKRLSSLELREIEKTKIDCARRFFEVLNQSQTDTGVRYDVVNNYTQLMQLVA